MNDTLTKIGQTGIVPVVVVNKVSDAEPLAEALIKGGLPCVEVTFRTDAAEESIRAIAKKFPRMLVGAGTVLNIEQVDRAVKAVKEGKGINVSEQRCEELKAQFADDAEQPAPPPFSAEEMAAKFADVAMWPDLAINWIASLRSQ